MENLPQADSVKELVSKMFLNDHGTPFVLTPTQEVIVESILKRKAPNGARRLHVKTHTQFGKLISHDTPVLTTIGWKTHGTLRIGDYVFNENGKPSRVLSLLSEGVANREVELSTGEKIKCHENHEWLVKFRNSKKRRTGFERMETKDIEKYAIKSSKAYNFSIPNIKPLFYPEVLLPVDPYTLGAWLGDGVSSKPSITINPKDKAIVDRIPYNRSSENIHKITGVVLYNYFRTFFWSGLKELGVVGNKHIPDIYKKSSIKQRLELLAGLIDTDGTVNSEFRKDSGHRNGRVYIANVNKVLIDDIAEIIRSLGMRPSITMVPACVSSSGICGRKDTYYIGFDPFIEIPTVLPRKKIIPKTKQRHVTIRSITKIEPVKGRCITVEGGIYLVGKNLVPTHNSESVAIGTLLLVSTYPEKVIVVAPSQAKCRIIISKIIKHAFENEYTLSRLSINDGESVERLRRERSKNRLTFNVGNNKIGEVFILSAEGNRKNAEDVGNAMMGFGGNILIEDESALIDDIADAKAMRMVGGYTAVGRDFVCKLGNPFRRNHFLKAERDEKYFKINADWQVGVKEGLLTQEFVEEMRPKPGFKVLYENKFPEDDEVDAQGWSNLFSEDDIERAMLKPDEPHPGHVGELRIGNDIARGGHDTTVWCLRSMAYAEILAVSRQNNLTEIAARTLALMKEYSVAPGNVYIDEIGVGGGAVDPLRAQDIQVSAVNVGNTAFEHARYTNLRAEAYFALKEWLRKGGRLSYDPEWYELLGIKYKADEKGRYKIMSKDIMRSRGIDSPNKADALMLTLARPCESAALGEFRRARSWLSRFKKDKNKQSAGFRMTSY